MVAAISSGTASLTDLGRVATAEIVPELEGISGVADVQSERRPRGPGHHHPRSDRARAERDQLRADPGRAGRGNVTIPGGELPSDDESIPVTTIGELTSVDQLESVVVGVSQAGPAPTPVTLGDVADVETQQLATTGYARINGTEALGLSISKTASANTVDVSAAVVTALEELVARSDADLKIDIVSDQADFIIESRDGLLREGGLGAVFAVLTIFLFLFSLRSTFVAAVSIPLSLLVALVVDAADRDHPEHHDPRRAGGRRRSRRRRLDRGPREHLPPSGAWGRTADRGARGPAEVAGAITSSTLTTVAVFLPLGFAGGLISQFFLPFALTVTFALVASLIVALTVIPVLAYFLVGAPRGDVDESGEPRRSFWVRLYDPVIRACAALALDVAVHRARRGSGSSSARCSSCRCCPTAFLNSGSEKILAVNVVAAGRGAARRRCVDRAAQAEDLLRSDDEVELVADHRPAGGRHGLPDPRRRAGGPRCQPATIFVRLDSAADLEAAALRSRRRWRRSRPMAAT